MAKQVKLDEFERKAAIEAYWGISKIGWHSTPEGSDFWARVHRKLSNMHVYGTSDGSPWVEPEPPKWKLLPFASAKEYLSQPRRLVSFDTSPDTFRHPSEIRPTGLGFFALGFMSWQWLLEHARFDNGTPCGVEATNE